MDSVKSTLAEMRDLFDSRMTAFEGDLRKAGTTTPSASSLAADFAAFKLFMLTAMRSLQDQVDMLAQETDRLDMRGRRKILLVHGVAEVDKEDTEAVVAEIVSNKLGVSDFGVGDIGRCHRMGRSSATRSRPILVKFKLHGTRDSVWFSKKKLKDTGVTLSEFLTKRRHDVFMAARLRFGVTKCWTRDGCIHVTAADGTTHRITTMAELSAIPSAGLPVSASANTSAVESDDSVQADKPAKAATQKANKTATDRPKRSTRK